MASITIIIRWLWQRLHPVWTRWIVQMVVWQRLSSYRPMTRRIRTLQSTLPTMEQLINAKTVPPSAFVLDPRTWERHKRGCLGKRCLAPSARTCWPSLLPYRAAIPSASIAWWWVPKRARSWGAGAANTRMNCSILWNLGSIVSSTALCSNLILSFTSGIWNCKANNKRKALSGRSSLIFSPRI